MATYKAVVLTTLLYCSETWTLYCRQIKQLEQFHQRCLRKILKIRWQDRVTNLAVLERCGLPSIESMILYSQLRWTGHVICMQDNRIPKILLYGQLREGHRETGRPYKRFKDSLKCNLKSCGINLSSWEVLAQDRNSWRQEIIHARKRFEERRALSLTEKRNRRIQRAEQPPSGAAFFCAQCRRSCGSRVGLYSHMRTHNMNN